MTPADAYVEATSGDKVLVKTLSGIAAAILIATLTWNGSTLLKIREIQVSQVVKTDILQRIVQKVETRLEDATDDRYRRADAVRDFQLVNRTLDKHNQAHQSFSARLERLELHFRDKHEER